VRRDRAALMLLGESDSAKKVSGLFSGFVLRETGPFRP